MSHLSGSVEPPSRDEIERLAETFGFRLNENELRAFEELSCDAAADFERIDHAPQPLFPPRHAPRDSGREPTAEEDPFSAFVRFCDVRGASDGALAERRVAIKDNVSVAGVPTTNGSQALPHHVPSQDAVVVERLLDAGARIVGKTSMDAFAFAGNGESAAFGIPRNPRDPTRAAGGSSGGSAAAVAAGLADAAIAVDQAGSARIPASWCGVVSIKPTYGLVSTYGVTYVDHTIDHVCPVAGSVEGVARTLEVIAGYDVRSPQREPRVAAPLRFADTSGRALEGLRLGVITEARSGVDPDVGAAFDDALTLLRRRGVETVELPVAGWELAPAILRGVQQSVASLVESGGVGYGQLGYVDVERQAAFSTLVQANPDELPPLFKLSVILARYFETRYLGTFYGKSQNLRMELTRRVDSALAECDLLVTPTMPTVAPSLGTSAEALEDFIRRGNSMLANTCPLNLTGHPALSLPIGPGAHGMPVGMQLIGRHSGERAVFGAAFGVEEAMEERTC